MWRHKTGTLGLFILITAKLFAQNNTVTIKGSVKDNMGIAIPFATVFIKNSSIGTVCDAEGMFALSSSKLHGETLVVQCMGYTKLEEKITYQQLNTGLSITLQSTNKQIDEVAVIALSNKEKFKRNGFATEVLESKTLQNIPSNINQALKTLPGLHIRETGGVGSGFTLSLNGLSGKQVRYFIDGIPTDNLGSVFNMNNFSVNMVENIVVYKGVVPIKLGADALGGAINIVTPSTNKDYLDFAYSLGSFNTHLISLSGNSYNNKTGGFIKGQAFHNYSDNSYKMYQVPLLDDLGNVEDNINATRFNDRYKSVFGSIETGWRAKKIADLISLQITAGSYHKNYQHTDFSTNNVFGKLHGSGMSLTATAKYQKTIQNFAINSFLMLGSIYDATVDTSSYRYNWQGKIISKTNGQGELFANKTLFKTNDKLTQGRINASYNAIKNSLVELSYAYQHLRKKGEDEVNRYNKTFSKPNFISKHTIGAAYIYKPKAIPVEISLFGKQYLFNGKVIYYQNSGNQIEEKEATPSFNQFGYGTTLSYQLGTALTVKSSFEKAYRTPENYEILGDGRYILPSVNLKPELSYNLNTGVHYNRYIQKINWIGDVNFFLRDSKNFIRVKSTGSPFESYENINNVRTIGVEGGASVNINKKWLVSGNITYQNITDQTRFDENIPNENNGRRVPNTPFLFANSGLAYNLLLGKEKNKLTLKYSTRYVKEFSLTFDHLGSKDSKNMIPSQFIQDISLDYALAKGKYNISCNAFNLANRVAYDNFKVQKPGRSFYVKLIYKL